MGGLTGAGVSSASGIPTYRDHEGNWLVQPILHEEFIQDEAKGADIGADLR